MPGRDDGNWKCRDLTTNWLSRAADSKRLSHCPVYATIEIGEEMMVATNVAMLRAGECPSV
jgi:hypothetical protein